MHQVFNRIKMIYGLAAGRAPSRPSAACKRHTMLIAPAALIRVHPSFIELAALPPLRFLVICTEVADLLLQIAVQTAIVAIILPNTNACLA
jgi:hypothetical protein